MKYDAWVNSHYLIEADSEEEAKEIARKIIAEDLEDDEIEICRRIDIEI